MSIQLVPDRKYYSEEGDNYIIFTNKAGRPEILIYDNNATELDIAYPADLFSPEMEATWDAIHPRIGSGMGEGIRDIQWEFKKDYPEEAVIMAQLIEKIKQDLPVEFSDAPNGLGTSYILITEPLMTVIDIDRQS